MKERAITGRHVLIGVSAAFAVIIGVNLLLAWKAIATFPGLEVANSYVVSQTFDANRKAQQALGWTASAVIAGDRLTLTIVDAQGSPAPVAGLEATLGRPTEVRDDRNPDFAFDGTAFVAPVEGLRPGNWDLRFVATAPDGTRFQQKLMLRVRG